MLLRFPSDIRYYSPLPTTATEVEPASAVAYAERAHSLPNRPEWSAGRPAWLHVKGVDATRPPRHPQKDAALALTLRFLGDGGAGRGADDAFEHGAAGEVVGHWAT